MGKLSKYVVITPARDEAQFIELTIRSVIGQTLLPVKWVIVSDGSTDGTDDIVKKYMAEYPWIELVRMPERRERNFAGKAHAFNAGYDRVKELEYEVIGNLDGDLSFDAGYFSFLLQKMSVDPALGVVGTPFTENASEAFYDYSIVGLDHVSGACQLFRRRCFEEIGGYAPMKLGGVDYVALTTARMKGWETKTFTEKACLHHRKMGTAQAGVLKAKYKIGVKDYVFGGHPLWEVFRTAYQMTRRPFLVGGLALGAGYVVAAARREERPIPMEMVAFRRREQMQRLKRLFSGNRISPIQTEQGAGELSGLDQRLAGEASASRSGMQVAESLHLAVAVDNSAEHSPEADAEGLLNINADDWGRDRLNTDRTLDCVICGAVSSVSAMMFMEDSERSAAIARELRIDTGLHLNLTTEFSVAGCPSRLIEHQERLAKYLRGRRLAQAVFHPGLIRSFEYVVAAQLEEFERLYGAAPERIDGHHHMHLCANVLLTKLLPAGTMIRRNFSFRPGEKSFGNRLYRRLLDGMLSRRHRLTDFFFSLSPLEPRDRLQRIFSLARQFVVEVETHPVKPEEYSFLSAGEIFRWTGDTPIASRCAVPRLAPVWK